MPDPLPRSRRTLRALVRRGWDARSIAYRPPGSQDDRLGHSGRQYAGWLRPVLESCPVGSRVLDLGCGCGIPTSRRLSRNFRVTGVDLSPVQIARAKALVPSGHFRVADMTQVRFDEGSFSAVVCFYAMIHVPVAEHPRMLRRIHRWLAPGGLFVATLGWTAWTGVERGWLGSDAPMYWSHAGRTRYRAWLREAGFEVLKESRVPEGKAAHALFVARKAGPPRRVTPGRSR